MYKPIQQMPPLWRTPILVTLLAIYLQVFLEWLFFVTKPSHFSSLTYGERVLMLLAIPLPLVVVGLLVVFPFLLLASETRGWLPDEARRLLTTLLPTFLVTCIVFLLIDNFTYTLFGFGITSLRGNARLAYGGLFVSLFIVANLSLFKRQDVSRAASRGVTHLVTALLLLSAVSLTATYLRSASPITMAPFADRATRRPGILLISADALQASRLSLYERCP